MMSYLSRPQKLWVFRHCKNSETQGTIFKNKKSPAFFCGTIRRNFSCFFISYIFRKKKTPSTICLILRWCPHLQWCWSILLPLWNQKAQLNYNEARYAWLLRRPVGATTLKKLPQNWLSRPIIYIYIFPIHPKNPDPSRIE